MAKIILNEEASAPASPAANTIALYTLDGDADANKVLYSKNPGGNIRVMANIPPATQTHDLGSSSLAWRHLYLGGASNVAKIVPGSTSISLRNNADNADNLIVTDAGAVTVRAGLTVTASGITVTAGGITITSGSLTMATAASKLVPGATSFSHRNNADSADNLLITDAGAVTVRAGLTVTAGGLTVTAGNSYLGDSANANMTLGLTINQGAADDEILALKSSDTNHGMTTLAEADTYANFAKWDSGANGVIFRGYSATTGPAMGISGIVTTDLTTKATNSLGATVIDGGLKSGTSFGANGANANVVVIRTGTTTRFIFDAEGDSHQDVGTAWTNFDDHDDIAMLTDLSVAVSRDGDPIKERFSDFLKYSRDALEANRIVTFNDDGHHFVNMSRLAMLLVGAVRQAGDRIAALETQIKQLAIAGAE